MNQRERERKRERVRKRDTGEKDDDIKFFKTISVSFSQNNCL